MIGNWICWLFALCLIFTKAPSLHDWHTRIAFALGFIFVGVLSKAVDVYRYVHESSEDNSKKQNT